MTDTVVMTDLRSRPVERVVPLVVAKRMGLRVALLSPREDPDLPARRLVDDVIHTNPHDKDRAVRDVEEYARTHSVRGLVTWTDRDVELVSHLGERLELPTVSPAAARRAHHRIEMREALAAAGDLSPAYRRVTSREELEEAAAEIGFPAVFKPLGASDHRAIFRVEEGVDLDRLYRVMLVTTDPRIDPRYGLYPREYVYEELLDGEEVSVEGIIQNGEIQIAGVTDTPRTSEYSIEYTARFPSGMPPGVVAAVKRDAVRALRALQLDHCAFHIEGRATKDGLRVLEVAARPAGGFIASHLVEMVTGCSMLEQILRVAIGETAVLPAADANGGSRTGALHIVLPPQAGTVTSIRGLAEAMEVPGMRYVIPSVSVGQSVDVPPVNFSDSLACLLACHDTLPAVDEAIAHGLENLHFEVDASL